MKIAPKGYFCKKCKLGTFRNRLIWSYWFRSYYLIGLFNVLSKNDKSFSFNRRRWRGHRARARGLWRRYGPTCPFARRHRPSTSSWWSSAIREDSRYLNIFQGSYIPLKSWTLIGSILSHDLQHAIIMLYVRVALFWNCYMRFDENKIKAKNVFLLIFTWTAAWDSPSWSLQSDNSCSMDLLALSACSKNVLPIKKSSVSILVDLVLWSVVFT